MRIAVVAFAGLLACACGQSGDLSAMLGAFGEAQRSLTAEYLVSVVTVAEEVLPGFQVDVTVNSTAPSVSTNSYCPAPPKEFELFVIEEVNVNPPCCCWDAFVVHSFFVMLGGV